MKIIAHRGNIDGPNPLEENKPEHIEEAISKGFDVEIDVRYDMLRNNIYLGHDESQYLIDWYWLGKYKDNLWIHCKNIEAVIYFKECGYDINYFWHETDAVTLTSKKYIWAYPGKQPKNSNL